MLSDILVMTRDCPSVRILKYPTILEKNPQWKEVEQRADHVSGVLRIRKKGFPSRNIHGMCPLLAPMSKICYPRVSRWEIFAPIARLGYMLRVARVIGLPGVCSQERSALQTARDAAACNTLQQCRPGNSSTHSDLWQKTNVSSFCTLSWLCSDPG